MDIFGWHSLRNYQIGYERTARHKSGGGALQREDIQVAGFPSRRKENELMPDAADRPRPGVAGDTSVTKAAGCSDDVFASAALDFTVHGAIRDSSLSKSLVLHSCSTPGVPLWDAEERKMWEFLRRE